MLQAERVAEELDAQIGKNQVYYRFSADRGLESPESILLSNLGAIESHTRAYLQQANASRDMENCVRASEVCGYVSTADLYCAPIRAIAATHGLPPLCASFVMRQEVMDSMFHFMFDSKEESQKIMILSGMGGSGKTQLISKFARTYLSRFQHVIFIDARTTESIKSGIISRVRSLGGVCTTLEEALDFLAQMDPHSSPWFLILDNADDPSLDVGPVIPNCEHGYVAITTRNPTVGDLNPQGHIKLDVMSEAEALQALLKTIYNSMEQASGDNHIEGRVVVKELGFLPVAIVQAGSYIKHQGRGCMKDYLERFKMHRQKLLAIPAKSQRDRHHHAVYATLDVTLDVLSTPAKNLLGILACFNYTGFPLPLVDRASSRKFLYEPFDLFDRPPEFQETAQFLSEIFSLTELRDLDLLTELEQFSLVVRVKNYSMVTLRFHPLVHAWMSDKIASEDNRKYWRAALRLLECGTGEADEDLFQYLIPQLVSLSPTRDNAHWNDLAVVARLRMWEGDNKAAITIWKEIYQEAMRVYGAAHLRTATAKLQLALAYSTTSLSSTNWETLTTIEEVVAIRRQLLSASHPDTLEANSAILDLKVINPFMEISDLAISRQVDVVKSLHQVIGHESQLLALKSQELLAKMYMKRKKWVEAKIVLLELTRMRARIQGKDHWMTLRSRQLLANLYTQQAQSIENTDLEVSISAENLQKEVVADMMKQQGPHHVDTLKAQQSLAELYYQTGQYTLSDATWRKVIEGYNTINGAHNIQVVGCMESWIKVLDVLGQHREEILELQQLAKKYKEIGNNGKAREAMQFAVKLLKGLGDSGDAVAGWGQLIVAYKAMGDYGEVHSATESLTRLLAEVERSNDAVAWWEQLIIDYKTMSDYGGARSATESLTRLLVKVGRSNDAVAWWEQLIVEYKEMGDNREAIKAMGWLAELLKRLARQDDAVTQWKQWIKEWKVKGEDRMAVQATGSLVRLLEKMERYDDVVARLDQVIEEAKTKGDSRMAVRVTHWLAGLLEKWGRQEDVVVRWERWIGEWKEKGNIWDACQAMKSQTELLERMERHDDAAAQWEKLIEEWTSTGNNLKVHEAMKSLAKLLEKMGRYDDAVARWEQWIGEWKGEGNNRQAGQATESLAKLLEKMGRYDDAVARWEQWIGEWKGEGNNRQAGQATESLAKLLEKMGRYDDAVARWEQVIDAWNWEAKAKGSGWHLNHGMQELLKMPEQYGSAAGGKEHYDDSAIGGEDVIEDWGEKAIHAMQSLAELLEKMGRNDDARAWWEQATAEWKVKGNHWRAAQAMESLAKLLETMGRYEEAKAWRVKIRNEEKDCSDSI